MEKQASAFFDEALASAGERLRQSTVQVFDGRRGHGSGVIWRADGWIVTNAHVARGPRTRVLLADGREFAAEIIGKDRERDLAALFVDASDLHLPSAEIGASGALRVGELVLAIGSPFGIRGAVSTGVLHAIGPVQAAGEQSWLQADLQLAPGNSGGALADAEGRVIGINTMIAMGLGLAIPSHDVEQFLRRVLRQKAAA
jgi:serine protease Do